MTEIIPPEHDSSPATLGEHVWDQTTEYLQQVQDLTRRSDHEMVGVIETVGTYLETRSTRAEELKGESVTRARSLTAEYYESPLRAEGVLDPQDAGLFIGDHTCMDGRTRAPIQFGRPAKGGGTAGGGSMRFPGGRPSGVYPDGVGGELMLDRESTYARELKAGLTGPSAMLQIVDSHQHCLAATNEAHGHMHAPQDHGLLRDVVYKKQLAKMIDGVAKEKGVRHRHFMHTSFDPHSGYVTLGLENTANMHYAAENGGYTPEVLETLAANGGIVRMEEIVNRDLQRLFLNHFFEADWSRNYVETARNFAEGLLVVGDEAVGIVGQHLRKIYRGKQRHELALIARAAVANGYNGWLHNVQGRYPYSEHTEAVVAALVGGEYGPFPDAESLEIFRDDPGLTRNAQMASTIVRGNRAEGRVPGDPDGPVPLIVQGRITHLPEGSNVNTIIDAVVILNENLPRLDWQSWSYENFSSFLSQQFPHLSAATSHAIARLGTSMRGIYDPSGGNFSVFAEGSMIPVPTLVGPYREPIAVLNFVPKKKSRR